MKSTLLQEAIADAKAVRATALANAKSALEEAFTQRFSAVFADKLREDSALESSEQSVDEGTDKDKVGSTKPSKSDGTKPWSKDNASDFSKNSTKDITPHTVPAGKDGGDGTKGLSDKNKGNFNNNSNKKNLTPNLPGGKVDESADKDDDTKDTNDMEESVTNEDLDEIIRELEAEAGSSPLDDPSAGGDSGSPSPDSGSPTDMPSTDAGGEPLKSGDTITITKVPSTGSQPTDVPIDGGQSGEDNSAPSPGGDVPPQMEEEIDLNELLASLNEESKSDKGEDNKDDADDKENNDDKFKDKLNEITSQRDEAYQTVQYLKTQINEINLLNAKLLYTNKLFKEFGMNRDQKVKVVEAFDLTKNVREVKMTYANWCESLNFGGKAQRKANAPSMTTITEGLASKATASTKPSEIITEGVNDMAQRFKKLAGINVKK